MLDTVRTGAIVGREIQLSALQAFLSSACSGHGHILFVAGDAGVGKTRLVRELLRQVDALQSPQILQGRTYDQQPAPPFSPFIDALRGLVREHGPTSIADTARPWIADLLYLMPELEPLVSGLRLDTDPHVQKQRLFEAIYRALCPRATDSCRIIILEDLHWADETSLELLRYLANAVQRDRLLILATYRTDEMHRLHPLSHLLNDLRRERLLEEVHLEPLQVDEVAQLIEEILHARVPTDVVAALHERTGGNPFFIEELVGTLHQEGDDGLLHHSVGHTYLATHIPASIRDSILRRLAQLDPTTLEVLRYAAVVGRRFDFDLLLRLTGMAESQLLRAVQMLIDNRLVVEERQGRDELFSFRHALTREVVYADLLLREQRLRHREILRALEEIHGMDAAAHIEALAYHSREAREREKATHYARLAGDRAARMSAHREAAGHYEVVLELAETIEPAERGDVLHGQAWAFYALGELDRAWRAWSEARELFEGSGNEHRAAGIYRWLGQIAWDRGNQQSAQEYARTAITILEQGRPSAELAMAYSRMSQLMMLTDQAQESITWGERALRMAEDTDALPVTVHALNNIGTSLIESGELDKGIAHLQRSLELARGANLWFEVVRAYHNFGVDLFSYGDIEQARMMLEEGIRCAEQHGYDRARRNMLVVLAQVQLERGFWDDAERLLADALAGNTWLPIHDPNIEVMFRADLLQRRGLTDEALQLLEVEAQQYQGPGAPEIPRGLAAALISAYIDSGQNTTAIESFDHLCALVQADIPTPKCQFLPDLGILVAEAIHDGERAAIWLKRLEHMAEQIPSPFNLAKRAHANGLVEGLAGRHSSAAEYLGEAITQAESNGWIYQALCYRRLRAEQLLLKGEREDIVAARREIATTRATALRLGAGGILKALDDLEQRFRLVPPPSSVSATRPSSGLTRREREVLDLLVRGTSNRGIAELLFISEKTAEFHVGNILGKLSLSSRVEAAAYALTHGLATLSES